MSNAVTKPAASGLAALGALRTGLSNVRAKLPTGSGDKTFLKMLQEKDGWVFGAEQNAVATGTEAVINTLSMKRGYISWPDKERSKGSSVKLPRERMYPVTAMGSMPEMHELPPQDESDSATIYQPWADQIEFDLKLLDGKHKGTQLTYNNGSRGGMKAFGALVDEILNKLAEETSFVCPIVKMGQSFYPNKTYGGRTWEPEFEVVGWMDLEGNEEGDDTTGTPPVRKVENKAEEPAAKEPDEEPAAEPEQEEAPVRRRRRA